MDFVNAGFGSGLLPAWCQAITKTNDDFLSIDLARTISIGILVKPHLFLSGREWQPFFEGPNVQYQCKTVVSPMN